MKRLSRLVPCVALACSLALPVFATSALAAPPAPADAGAPPAATPPAPTPDAGAATPAPAPTAPPDAAATAPPPATAPADAQATAPAAATTAPAAGAEIAADQTVAQQVDDFWHYGEIGRYDLQAMLGAKIIAAGQQAPEDVLKAFEAAAPNHHSPGGAPGDIDIALLRWQAADPKMKQVATDVIGVLNKARFARRQNPQFIAENIKRLTGGERAYSLAMEQLSNSGELAVPQLVAILLNPAPGGDDLRDVSRRALVGLGRSALNPLLAATQMDARDPALTTICSVLGEIGYPISAPYLVALARSNESSNEVREAATVALRRLNNGPTAAAGAGDLFYGLAQQFYAGTASIQPDPRSPKAFIWYWQDRNLVSKAVPPQIFNDIMAMRESEYALRLQASNSDQAVSLWLAANIRRGLDLPAGETDPTRGADEPAAHYYNVAEGAKYLNLVLDRSLRENTPQGTGVALAAIKSLQNIVGQSNLFSGTSGQPLVDAMRSPDRQVRFEAAYAIGSALPQHSFQGQDNVVPLLAEAVAQSGTAGVLVVGSQEDRARIASELKDYAVDGGADASAAISNAGALPGVDVIVMSEDIGNPQIDRVIALGSQTPRLARVAKLVIVHSLASPWVRMSLTDPTLSYTEATAGQPLIDAVEQARKKAGGAAMDAKSASDASLRAAHLLARLAISRGQVLNLAVAEPTLLSSLGDKRPEVVQAVGDAVALLESPRAQAALAQRAADGKTPPEMRVSLYKALATSAKFNGNKLDPSTLGDLQQVVVSEKDLSVRSAAAEARGALNLPAEQVKSLILDRHD